MQDPLIPLTPEWRGGPAAPPMASTQAEPLSPIGRPWDDAFAPMPAPLTGELVVDPEIVIRAKKFPVEIGFNFSNNQQAHTEFGGMRTATTRRFVTTVSNGNVSITYGDFSQFNFTLVGTSGGITTFTANPTGGPRTTLTFDGTTFKELEPSGKHYEYQSVDGSVNTFRLTKIVDAAGVAQTYSYSSNPDESGLLKTIQVPGGRLITFTYTPGLDVTMSLVSSIQDWGGRIWTFQYDGFDFLTTLTSPLGCVTAYTYFEDDIGAPHNHINSITDPLGFVTSYTYDGSHRVQTMAQGSGTWTYNYVTTFQSSVQAPSGALTTYNYDSVSLNLSTVDHPEGYRSTFTYDSNNFVTGEQTPTGWRMSMTYNSLGMPLTSKDGLGNTTTYQYDANLNLTTLIDATGATTTFGYDSQHNLTRISDSLGRVTSYGYDSDGQLTKITTARGLVTSLAYDSFGNLTTMTDSDGGLTTYSFDTLNRPTSAVDPIGRQTTYAYDAGDNVTGMTDPTGARTTYIYQTCLLQAVVDPLGNRTSYTYG